MAKFGQSYMFRTQVTGHGDFVLHLSLQNLLSDLIVLDQMYVTFLSHVCNSRVVKVKRKVVLREDQCSSFR